MPKFLGSEPYRQTTDDKRTQQELRAAGKLPRHIAVIMDGNGRWAEERGLPRAAGHQAGIASLRDVTRSSRELGIDFLTVYAFSTENWKRPKREVSMLFRLLVKMLREELREMLENGVRLKTIGQTSLLPDLVQKELNDAIERTANNKGLTLTLALSYSGRWDLTRAMQAIALDVRAGKLSPEDISEETIRAALTTTDMPDPDLLVRTSGEMRLSNFLLWELAYSEIHVTKTLWPDFRRDHLYEAIREYQKRERRFGLTGAQLKTSDDDVSQDHRSYVDKLISKITGG
ncbi:MAG TPA: isoprenyl transferase [Candidatus Kapabacteria bacterium]